MKLRWERSPGSGGDGGGDERVDADAVSARPLVVLLTWVGAQEKHIATYVQIFDR